MNRTFSFLSELLSKFFSAFRPKRNGNRIEAPTRYALDPARTAPFDPQVARRMAQLEAELTRLAESQYAAREERVRLSEEVARLRNASAPRTTHADPHAESQLAAELAAELGQDQ